MKEYIKPAMEVVAVESLQTMLASSIIIDQDGTVIDPTVPGNQWAPSRKGRMYVVEDDEDEEGFGW